MQRTRFTALATKICSTRATTLGVLLLAFFVLACSPVAVQPARPAVVIASPPSGGLYTLGETVVVQSTATDPANILRVALVVDGVVVHEDASPVAIGQPQFSVIQSWVADKVGQHNLIVRATNAQGGTTDAGIVITVQSSAVIQPTPTIASTSTPTAALPIATLAMPDAPTLIPAITVVVTATPVNTASPTPTKLAPATLAPPPNTAIVPTKTTAPKTLVPVPATPVPATAVPATAAAPTTAPTLAKTTGCSGQPAAFTFTASAATITAGQSITLNWGAVTNASIAVLNGGAFNAQGVGAPGTVNASPTATTTYTLTATCNNGGGTRTASVTVIVTVNPPPAACGNPTIGEFFASRNIIYSGTPVTITWNGVTGADQITLTGPQLNQKVGPSGSQTFTLTASGTFRLEAICNATAQATALEVTVGVRTARPQCSGAVSIDGFTADKTTITNGESITLNWGAVANADSITLDLVEPIGGGLVAAPGTLTIQPTTSNTYTLTARCSFTGSSAFNTVTITVNP